MATSDLIWRLIELILKNEEAKSNDQKPKED